MSKVKSVFDLNPKLTSDDVEFSKDLNSHKKKNVRSYISYSKLTIQERTAIKKQVMETINNKTNIINDFVADYDKNLYIVDANIDAPTPHIQWSQVRCLGLYRSVI